MKAQLANPGISLRSLLLAALTACVIAAPAAGEQIVRDEAVLTGKQVYAFTDDGEQVAVVLGDFSFTAGQRRLSGRNAVLWILPEDEPRTRRIVVYVEGAASARSAAGKVTRQDAMIVRLRQKGRLSAEAKVTDRELDDFPLYRRALEAREGIDRQRASRPDEPAEPQPTTQVRAEPVDAGPGDQATAAAESAAPAEVAEAAEEEKRPQPAAPVSFRADRFSSEERADGERVIIAIGDVYLSRGAPDSQEFIELRSQVAVVFTGPGGEKDVSTPFSPELEGVTIPGADGEGGRGETITGVYLEGDVVIGRGERYMRGPAAFYDLTTDRAVVMDPVFRTIQEQRNIPIYVRAKEARALSAREVWFRDATVTTSDFYTPSYGISAERAYMMDTTPYDPQTGEALGEQRWRAKMSDATMEIGGWPVFYLPVLQGDLEQGNSPLRTARVGNHGRFGFGAESEWHLFRLLGLLEPEGVDGQLDLSWYERGWIGGVDVDYARRDFRGNEYTGYTLLYGVIDDEQEDEFGDERDNIDAPRYRGRILSRHKHFLPNDWQLQFELSYICDRNFLEQFFRDEFYAGKEQETLAYAKKQRDNWAFTTLLQYRMNRFLTQTESFPDLGLHLIGQPLWKNRLTFFHESHAGLKRWRPDNDLPISDTRMAPRLDTREEINVPMTAGPINLVPYAVGRLTYWDDERPRIPGMDDDTETFRPYGQVGVKANTHVWRVYDGVESRLWDVHRLKHIITPQAVGFLASTHGVSPDELIPMDPDIERHLTRISGVGLGLYQRLQTKRGRPGHRRTVDWMRLNLTAGFYDNGDDPFPSDGRIFWSRPEYSIGRNHVNAEYIWNISDATALLADANYDVDNGDLGRGNIGVAVSRDPRLRYYAGVRYLRDLDSGVGTFGVNYQINRKYSLSVFEQYDFDYDGGENLATAVTLTRKLPRWYAAFTFSYDATMDDLTVMLTLWPEGIPEVRLGGQSVSMLSNSERN